MVEIYQQKILLSEKSRGFHLITREVMQTLPARGNIRTGMCQVYIQHTSASLAINESVDSIGCVDFGTFFNKAIKENNLTYEHNDGGSDDMRAHVKSSLLGNSVLIPIRNGQLALGVRQEIYLCEHRNHGGARSLVITAWGSDDESVVIFP